MDNKKQDITIKHRSSVYGLDGIDKKTSWAVKTNDLTKRFIRDRFIVLRDFIPKDIMTLTLDSWKTVENNPEYEDVFFTKEEDIIFDSPKDSLYKSSGAYCFPPAVALHRWLRDNLRGVLDFQLTETYSYTRKYARGAFLKSHTDRPSCEISATICLDYKTDDNTPWKIWVQNDQNYIDRLEDQEQIYRETQMLPHRERTGISVSLEPGDVLLYQGPNIPHWRDYLLGDYSYHMFLHFIRSDTDMRHIPNGDKFIKRVSNTAAGSAHTHPLEYDGRKNRYDTLADKKELEEWYTNIYMPCPNKSRYVNNFEEMEEK